MMTAGRSTVVRQAHSPLSNTIQSCSKKQKYCFAVLIVLVLMASPLLVLGSSQRELSFFGFWNAPKEGSKSSEELSWQRSYSLFSKFCPYDEDLNLPPTDRTNNLKKTRVPSTTKLMSTSQRRFRKALTEYCSRKISLSPSALCFTCHSPSTGQRKAKYGSLPAALSCSNKIVEDSCNNAFRQCEITTANYLTNAFVSTPTRTAADSSTASTSSSSSSSSRPASSPFSLEERMGSLSALLEMNGVGVGGACGAATAMLEFELRTSLLWIPQKEPLICHSPEKNAALLSSASQMKRQCYRTFSNPLHQTQKKGWGVRKLNAVPERELREGNAVESSGKQEEAAAATTKLDLPRHPSVRNLKRKATLPELVSVDSNDGKDKHSYLQGRELSQGEFSNGGKSSHASTMRSLSSSFSTSSSMDHAASPQSRPSFPSSPYDLFPLLQVQQGIECDEAQQKLSRLSDQFNSGVASSNTLAEINSFGLLSDDDCDSMMKRAKTKSVLDDTAEGTQRYKNPSLSSMPIEVELLEGQGIMMQDTEKHKERLLTPFAVAITSSSMNNIQDSIKSGMVKRSPLTRNTATPQWHVSLTMNVELSAQEKNVNRIAKVEENSPTLAIQIWDQQFTSRGLTLKAVPVGSLEIPLQEILKGGSTGERWYPLQHGTSGGKVLCRIRLSPSSSSPPSKSSSERTEEEARKPFKIVSRYLPSVFLYGLNNGVFDQRPEYRWNMYEIPMKNVRQIFGNRVQHYNRNYDKAQQIFGKNLLSKSVRGFLRRYHDYAYDGSSFHAETGYAMSAENLLSRLSPCKTYTYALMDDFLHFSETGKSLRDYLSKHALHARASPIVRYAGEFHIERIGGLSAAYSDGQEDGNSALKKYKLVMDNNSGTYAPASEDLHLLAQVLALNFPGLTVETHSYDERDYREHEKNRQQMAATALLDPQAGC